MITNAKHIPINGGERLVHWFLPYVKQRIRWRLSDRMSVPPVSLGKALLLTIQRDIRDDCIRAYLATHP